MTRPTYRLPFGSDLSAGYEIDGVRHEIDGLTVEKVGAWIPRTDTEFGHYAEIEFALVGSRPVRPARQPRVRQLATAEQISAATKITNELGHGDDALRAALDTDY